MKSINNNDRAELVVDSPQANYAIHAKKELRYLSIFIVAKGAWVIAPFVFINTGRSIYKGKLWKINKNHILNYQNF